MDNQLNTSSPCDPPAKGANMTRGCINGNIECRGNILALYLTLVRKKIAHFSCPCLN